jgi:threonyl-tRNA synthetase
MDQPLRKGKFTHFYWTHPGEKELHEIVNQEFSKHDFFSSGSRGSAQLLRFIQNELGMARPGDSGDSASHIQYMRQHDLVDYCEASEKGHMKWFPKGVLIMQLLGEYARRLSRDWGAFEMKNPLLIRGDQNTIGTLMGEFHERDYKVDGGRGIGFLRYASDPLGFPFMQQVKFTKAQSPLRVYEEANCFRNEQDGEVSGLKRMRWFIMSDMHAACSSVEEAHHEYTDLSVRFGKLMDDIIAPGRWVLGWELTQAAYDEHRDWLKDISDSIQVPSLFKVMPEMSHYYAFKNEYQGITSDGSNVQVSTVQWDVKNGPRFNIGYIGDDSKKHPSPVIVHASSIGSVERALCCILENIAIDVNEGKTPQFPLWLAPTQVRFIPVNDTYTGSASDVVRSLPGLRVDIDDRNETVQKRVRNAASEWVPYTVVFGQKELENDILPVRIRGQESLYPMTRQTLANQIQSNTGDMPYLPLSLPTLLSRRPLFK